MPFKTATLAGPILLLCCWSANAGAEAWEIKAQLGPVFATEFSPSRQQGLGVQASLNIGLNEFLSISVAGGHNRHFFGSGVGYAVSSAGVGLEMNLDVILFGVGLAWVPFAGLRLGYLRIDATEPEPDRQGLGVQIAIGLDYVFSERAYLGIGLEYQGLLTDLQGLPGYLGIALRLGLRWLD
jgi:hypothetical protein